MGNMEDLAKEVNQILEGTNLGNPQEIVTMPVIAVTEVSPEAGKIATQEVALVEDIARKTQEVAGLETIVISIQQELANLRALAEKKIPEIVPFITPVTPVVVPVVAPKVAVEPPGFVKKNWPWLLLGGAGVAAIVALAAKK